MLWKDLPAQDFSQDVFPAAILQFATKNQCSSDVN